MQWQDAAAMSHASSYSDFRCDGCGAPCPAWFLPWFLPMCNPCLAYFFCFSLLCCRPVLAGCQWLVEGVWTGRVVLLPAFHERATTNGRRRCLSAGWRARSTTTRCKYSPPPLELSYYQFRPSSMTLKAAMPAPCADHHLLEFWCWLYVLHVSGGAGSLFEVRPDCLSADCQWEKINQCICTCMHACTCMHTHACIHACMYTQKHRQAHRDTGRCTHIVNGRSSSLQH